eukprot:gb/GEZN01000494.1/.p1 GENE.gb/GEZN01000494.1/~~gb/GEZN01000494.1/.p1  ORF type:complete len:1183 (-),score=128.90 gb/GEZN01000494.1/:747-4238(-)
MLFFAVALWAALRHTTLAGAQPTCVLESLVLAAIDPAARLKNCSDGSIGSSCTLSCIDGYVASDEVAGVCTENSSFPTGGYYRNLHILCSASTCSPLDVATVASIDPNAMLSSSACPEDGILGSKCFLECVEGYDPLQPSFPAMCLPDPGTSTASYQGAVIACAEHDGCTVVPCPVGASCEDHPPPWEGREGRTCTCNEGYVAQEQCCYEAEREPCRAGQFQCRSGRCIQDIWVCSGEDECGDNSDEINCIAPCPQGTFACRNGKCVSSQYRCSTTNECGDNSDELDCFTPCPEFTTACGSGQCIPLWTLCDRRQHCLDGADERDCSNNCDPRLFACGNGRCIPQWWVCNDGGNNLCGNFADEIGCSPPCLPDCEDKTCGDDDCCNGKCRVQTCPQGKTCNVAGLCECVPSCVGNVTCGSSDGCGGRCFGSCDAVLICEQPNHHCGLRLVYSAEDLPLSMSDQENQFLSSVINVTHSGTVMDINVLHLRGLHTWFADLRFELLSPFGSVVEILRRSCSNGNRYQNFNFSLDDDATTDQLDCPPTLGKTYRPSFPLSQFHGEQALGLWTLLIWDEFSQDAGTLQAWQLEVSFCEPNCEGKTCGQDDGCGDVCTVPNRLGCHERETCVQGECHCTPDCSEAVFCGASDGCGGHCSNSSQGCARDQDCLLGVCAIPIYNSSEVPVLIRTGEKLQRVSSQLWVPCTTRTVRQVQVLDLVGQHSYLGQLTFFLTSPQGTIVTLMAPRCGSYANFHLSLTDDASLPVTAGPCPATDGATYQPTQPLSAFNLQQACGSWTLGIMDEGSGDGGRLEGWALRIKTCENNCIDKQCGEADGCGGLCIRNLGCDADQECTQQGTCRSNSTVSATSSITPRPRCEGCVGSPACDAVDSCGKPCPGALELCRLVRVEAPAVGPIPDHGQLTKKVWVETDLQLAEVRVHLTGDHQLLGDLLVSLRSPAGTEVLLLSHPCGVTPDFFDLTVQDLTGVGFPCPPPQNGSVVPTALQGGGLSVLRNQASKGEWALVVEDTQVKDTGSMGVWALEFRGSCPPDQPDCTGCTPDCQHKLCGKPDGCDGTCQTQTCADTQYCALDASQPANAGRVYTCFKIEEITCDVLDAKCVHCIPGVLECLGCRDALVSLDGLDCVSQCSAGEVVEFDGLQCNTSSAGTD